MPHVVREIFSLQDPAFEPAYSLFLQSFAPDELEPRQSIEARIQSSGRIRSDGRISHFLVLEVEREVKGVRIHDFYPRVGLGWLVYLAIHPEARGQQAGAHLLRCGVESCRLDALYHGVAFRGAILEMERIRDAKDEVELAERIGRLEFFTKQGAVFLTDGYTQPALAPGMHPVPLNLFLLSGASDLSPEERDSILLDYHVHLWGMEPDSPSVREALEGVNGDPWTRPSWQE